MMKAAARQNDLGSLGFVSHKASEPTAMAVAMIGRKYRVVTYRIENGAIVDERPADGLLFDSINDARAHRKALIAKA